MCVRQLCSLIRRANSIHGEFNTRTTTKQDRTVNWKYAGKDVDCDGDGKLEATDTCSLRTCRGEAQSQRQLASEWTVLATLVAAVQPQQQHNIQVSLAERNVKKYVKLCL